MTLNERTPSSSTEAQGESQPNPVKIPPPPTEQPPPYTPFISSNVGRTNDPTPSRHIRDNRRNVVQPQGFRRYLQYLTPLNLLVAVIAVIALFVLIYVIHKSNASDEDSIESLEGAHKALRFKNRALGAFKNARERISFDEINNSIILSEYDPHSGLLKSEVKNLDDHLAEFDYSDRNLVERYSECMRWTSKVFCCSTPSHSRHHKTDCFLQPDDGGGKEIHSVAVMYDMASPWQSLDDGEKLLIIRNRQRHSVLDLKNHKIYKIEENRLPHGYYSVAFFFPMDTADELSELVRKENEFRICSYLRTTSGDYALAERRCEQTPFTVDFELHKVLFCTNPLYTAVVQYGHLEGERDVLTWRLRVKYDSSPEIYSTSESLESRVEQVAIDCNDNELVVFAMGVYELHEYSVRLPNLRSEHFIQTRST